MKNVIRIFGLLAFAALFSSCTQTVETSVDGSVFDGTWNGTLTCAVTGASAATMKLTANGSTVTFQGNAGAGSCAKSATFTGNVVNDHVDFSTQLNVDNCGYSNTMSGSAYLHNGQLMFSESVSGPTLTTTCSFVGTKQ